MYWRSALLLVGVVFAASVAPAAGQRVPGYQADHDEAAMQFRAWALGEYMATFEAWMEAVNADDVAGAMQLYTPDAAVELDGPRTGSAAIEAGLGEWVAGVNHVRAGLADFEASGRMAYGAMRVVISHEDGSPPTSATLTMVMLKDGSDFRIRSQILMLR